MKTNDFLAQLEDAAVVAAIAAAEKLSSGEIRVYVSQREISDAVAQAQARFEKLGMSRTRERNAVLIYFAPRSQKFAIIGDSGVHAICGQDFWQEVAVEVQTHLRQQQFTAAAVHAVQRVGAVLARHFPRRDDDQNELPDKVERD